MTPKEIVQRTIEYRHPERLARSFHPSDLAGAACQTETYATEWQRVDEHRWERKDEWGNLWARIDPTSKGEVVRGVLERADALDSYRFPDYSNPEAYESVRQQCHTSPDVWVNGWIPGFAFSIARKMRKLDQYLMDLMLEPERMHTLHDRIDAMVETIILGHADAGVDGIMFCEDWGTQGQTLISPALWREEFFPRFQKLCALAHDRGLKVFMHSCGNIGAIVPGLIEAGIDVLQFDQPDLHGIDTLADYQKNAPITFWCPVDIQKTLQQRDENVIRDKVREMVDKLWHGRGGLIAGIYPDDASIGLDPVWQEHACDAFTKDGVAERYTNP